MKAGVSRLSFEPAKGGTVSHLEMKKQRSGQGGGPMHEYQTENTIHPTMEHAKAHLEKQMGYCYGENAGKESMKEEKAEAE